MWKKRQKQADLPKHQKDTLIIIGNGFDIWQGLDTSYAQFQTYYLANRDAILKKLHIKKHTIMEQDGTSYQITDVEIIYGDPFDPSELDMPLGAHLRLLCRMWMQSASTSFSARRKAISGR